MKVILSPTKILGIILEACFIFVISYVLYKFLNNYMTTTETLYVYGLIGFLLSFKLENKIDRIVVIVFILALLSPMPYWLFGVGVYFLYIFAYNGVLRIKP